MSQRAVVDDVVEQHAEVGVDRVVARRAWCRGTGEHLDVAGLVHDLGRGVVLGVDPRDRLDDLGGAEQSALLAVHELAEGPVLLSRPSSHPLGVSPHFSNGVPT
jgi:hypothetical protein